MWSAKTPLGTFRRGPLLLGVALFCLLCCLFPSSLGNQVLNRPFASTAAQEWERVLADASTHPPPSFDPIMTTAGRQPDIKLPYKSVYFSVTRDGEAECDVDRCDAWDWSNHTHPTSYLTSRFGPASTVPPFVNNMTLMPDFVCYENWFQWAAATTSEFLDPIPAGNIAVQASVTLHGTFVCDYPETQFNIILRNDPISVNPIVLNATQFPQDCSCPICAQNITFTSYDHSGVGMPWYLYGQQNRMLILPLAGSLCLNAMEIRLYYQPKVPIMTKMWPEAGPREGGSSISVWMENFDTEAHYRCLLPAGEMVAVKIPTENRIECVTMKPCSPSEGRLTFKVYTVENPDMPIVSHVYTAYNQPIVSSITPRKVRAGQNITITGSSLGPRYDLGFTCRINGIETTQVFLTGEDDSIIVTIPPNLPENQDLLVQLSLNGQDWSPKHNGSIVTVTPTPIPPKKWYEMPKILYIVLGIIAGVLLVIIVVILACWRVHRNASAASDKHYSSNSDNEPLLAGHSFGPKTPSVNKLALKTIGELEKIDVSKIKLGKRIGKGSFGEVYVGTYLGTEVAVKKILASKISPEFMEEFAREAALMKDLRHPNVLQFIGAAMDEPDICIVTEYMPKGSLYHLLHDPKVAISWEMVRRIALDTAKGMAYLHLRTPAIIHRDLKSHNLLVDDSWKVKVCDFGLSKIAIDQQATMTACGTPCWTAPEILRNARYTTKADVFSYGIVLWELVTREEPFAGMPAFQVIFAVGTKGARLPLPQVCPPELIKLILSCWQEDPALRPPFSDIITYLERISFASD